MLETTPYTTKKRLGSAISGGDVPTSGTFLRRMPCVYKDYRIPFLKSLVFTEINQLPKTPGVQVSSLLFNKPNSLSNTFEILKHKTISFIKGFYKLFAYNMVNFPRDSSLLSQQPSQEAFCPLCALGLKRRPQPPVAVSYLFKTLNFEFNPVTCSSNTVDTKVNAYSSLYCSRWWDRTRKNYIEIKDLLSFVPNKSSRSWTLPFKKPKLVVSNGKPNVFNPTLSSREGNEIITSNKFHRKSSSIVFNRGRSKFFNLVFSFSISTNPSYSTYYKICREIVFFFNSLITKVLDFNLVRGFVFNRDFKNVIACFGEFKQGIMKNGLDVIRDFNFASYGFNKVHNVKYIT